MPNIPGFPMMKKLVAFLVVLMTFAGQLAFAGDQSDKDDKLDPQTEKLRNEFGLARLMFLRQVVKDSELDSSIRDAVVKVCDETREQILAAVDREKNDPSEDEDRKQTIKDLGDKFSEDSHEAMKSDPNADKVIGRQIQQLTYELELIRKGQLVEKMGDLELTEEQKSSIEEIAEKAKKKTKSKTADEVSKDEQAMKALLDARKKVREKLDDEQKTQWNAFVSENAGKSNKPKLGDVAPKP
jgi:hypothetical protein